MLGFRSDDERAAWALAESLLDRARAMMRQAESALEKFKVGKELNRQRCALRGISATDAEIRWVETASAKNALADNSFHVGLATMYYGAATAHYTRALYLHGRARLEGPANGRAPDELGRRPGHGGSRSDGGPPGRPGRTGDGLAGPEGSITHDASRT
jgi:hypothetical protein